MKSNVNCECHGFSHHMWCERFVLIYIYIYYIIYVHKYEICTHETCPNKHRILPIQILWTTETRAQGKTQRQQSEFALEKKGSFNSNSEDNQLTA